MAAHKSWLRRSAEALADRLDRLRQTLDALQERVREVVAQSIGQTVAGAVHDAVQAALALPRRVPMRVSSGSWGPYPRRPSWQEPEDRGWFREPEERWENDRWEEDRGEEEPPFAAEEAEPRQAKLGRALATGCATMAWWLQRWPGRHAMLAAIVLGLAATVVAMTGGSLTAAILSLVPSLLALVHLSGTAQAGRSALTPS